MKNLNLLPTDKPSVLGRFIDTNNLFLRVSNDIPRGENVNIYITSDEEIKDEEWVYDKILNSVFKFESGEANDDYINENIKKIILTTDEDLIKDGVQAIDNEFLEWFVKNPNCENVKVTKMLQVRHGVAWYDLPNQKEGGELEGIYRKVYKITIPIEEDFELVSIGEETIKLAIPMMQDKEEFKQIECYDKFNQLLKEGDYVDVQKDGVHQIYLKEDNQLYFKPYGKEDRVCSYFSNDMVKCDIDGNWLTDDIYEKTNFNVSKQETIEEVSEKLVKNHPDFNIEGFSDYHNGRFNGILEGIKWQQEQEQNNENSWFNEYQEVEDYIIKRIGDKFLEATPEKYNTASEATIALLENNWKQEQDENLYSEEIINMLDNVRYWDTCPDKYINIIESFLKQFKKK